MRDDTHDDATTPSDQKTTDPAAAQMHAILTGLLDEHAAPTIERVAELERHVAELERRLALVEARLV